MVAKAGAIQGQLLQKASTDVRAAMEAANPTATQEQLQHDFTLKVRSAIERELMRSYVDTGIMSKDLLKAEIDQWIL